MQDIQDVITNEAQTLLKLLSVEATVTVEQQEESYNLLIDTPENALLIGKHGNTLSSLEYIISLAVAQKTGEFKRIVLEIGDYRQEREAYLRDLTERFRSDVIATGFEKSIRGLKPWERRLIHIMLQEDEEVTTESMGEGKDRVLVIKKK